MAQFSFHWGDLRFDYQGPFALVIKSEIGSVAAELRHCIALALTYKLRKKSKD
ncbi:MAG: hypothetical protein HRU27_19115 [Rhizobiaceae bacterium]|nr:hypothetical protein [Hyphomicrobiales bacterium]NRB32705.1 hypothetical protein [Rhizobiaceae bacterium]